MKSVFISYSHHDHEFRDALITHLRVLQHKHLITTWHDGELTPGSAWKTVIDDKLRNSDIIVLLVSADFLGSSFCQDVELSAALRRWETNDATIIPVIVRACDWHASALSGLQALPKDARPVRQWPDPDEAWASVTRQIRAVAECGHAGGTSAAPLLTPPTNDVIRGTLQSAEELAGETAVPSASSGASRSPMLGTSRSRVKSQLSTPVEPLVAITRQEKSPRRQRAPQVRYYPRRDDIPNLRARLQAAVDEISLFQLNLGSTVDYVEAIGRASRASPTLRIRVLVLDPNSHHLEARIRMMDGDTGVGHRKECQTGIENFKAWAKKHNVRYELRLYDEPSTFIMFRIDDCLILSFITATGLARNLPHIEIPGPRTLPSAQGFLDHFEVLWDRAMQEAAS